MLHQGSQDFETRKKLYIHQVYIPAYLLKERKNKTNIDIWWHTDTNKKDTKHRHKQTQSNQETKCYKPQLQAVPDQQVKEQ